MFTYEAERLLSFSTSQYMELEKGGGGEYIEKRLYMLIENNRCTWGYIYADDDGILYSAYLNN